MRLEAVALCAVTFFAAAVCVCIGLQQADFDIDSRLGIGIIDYGPYTGWIHGGYPGYDYYEPGSQQYSGRWPGQFWPPRRGPRCGRRRCRFGDRCLRETYRCGSRQCRKRPRCIRVVPGVYFGE